MADAEFEYPVQIHWGDCDPAGIVYFPRYFDLFHQAMEAWFDQALSLPYADVIVQRKIGFPSVHTEADFTAPSAFGDRVAVRLTVARLGRSSIEFGYRVTAVDGGVLRATGKTVCVVMDLDPNSEAFRQALPMPTDLRERIEAFISGD